MNSNGTFSVGKTWKLNELRAVEVVTVSYASISVALSRVDTKTAVVIQYYPSEDVHVADRTSE
jgi:hypothetical protein